MIFTPELNKWKTLYKLADDDSAGGSTRTGTTATRASITQAKKAAAPVTTTDTVPTFVSGVSSSGGSSVSQDYLLPPILELLAEGRARRQAQRDSITNAIGGLLQSLPMAAPSANAIFPGFERGGIADVLMGIISGKGVQEGGATLDALRRPGTTQVPISALLGIGEPGVGEEAGGLMALAQAILNSGKTVSTGGSSQGSSSTNYQQVDEGAAGGGLDPTTLALMSMMFGGQMQGGGGTQRNSGYGFNPDTGELYFPQPSSSAVPVPVPSATYGR